MYSTSCVNTQHNITTYGVDRMVLNIKNYVSQQYNMTFLHDSF